MAKDTAASRYRADFIARTKAAREAKDGLTQAKMAKVLGMEQGTYKQYETRSLLPHMHIETFCLMTDVPVAWLVTGEGRVSKDVAELLRLAA